jgi:hypothetical protein
MPRTTRFISLREYVPAGRVRPEHFQTATKDIPDPVDGQIVLRPTIFSLDPTLRGQLTGVDNYYVPQVELGEPITGLAVSEVIESRDRRYEVGDKVFGFVEWAELSVSPVSGQKLRDGSFIPFEQEKIDPRLTEPSWALSLLALTGGKTAYTGMVGAGRVRAGETVLVSAAAGNVGSLAGQIAKLRGARVIGLAGTESKRKALTEQLGFDAALDYHAPDLGEQITALAPNGPDLYFDNVGGQVSQTVMWTMRRPARVVECGQIATYDHESSWTVDIRPIHANSLTFIGFGALAFAELFGEADDQLIEWATTRQLTVLQTERYGFDQLPSAFTGLLAGENAGKMVVLVP